MVRNSPEVFKYFLLFLLACYSLPGRTSSSGGEIFVLCCVLIPAMDLIKQRDKKKIQVRILNEGAWSRWSYNRSVNWHRASQNCWVPTCSSSMYVHLYTPEEQVLRLYLGNSSNMLSSNNAHYFISHFLIIVTKKCKNKWREMNESLREKKIKSTKSNNREEIMLWKMFQWLNVKNIIQYVL